MFLKILARINKKIFKYAKKGYYFYRNVWLILSVFNTSKKFDNVYIFNTRSGETYLTLLYINQIFKQDNTHNPLFIGTLGYHRDLIRCFYKKPYYLFKPEFFGPTLFILKNTFKIFNHKFRYILYYNYFMKLENHIRNDNYYFFDALVNELHISDIKHYKNPTINAYVAKTVSRKMQRIKLNIHKFVYISPESLSNDSIKKFMEKIVAILIYNGYDIFCNANIVISLIPSTKTCYLTHQESIVLAAMSKCIIGLRSGLMDILSYLDINKYVIYTDFHQRGELEPMDAEQVRNGFSLKGLPNVNKETIFEYVDNGDTNELVDNIVDDLKNTLSINSHGVSTTGLNTLRYH